MAAIPTKECRILSNIVGSSEVMMLIKSMSFDIKILWDFWIDSANRGSCMRSLPILVHWLPIPE